MYRYLRFPNFLDKAVTFSYDDGTIHDERLVGIFNSYGLSCTFNLNSGMYGEGRRAERDKMISLLRGSRHEVAVHGQRHRTLTYLDEQALRAEVGEDKLMHESDYGMKVTGLAYPYGKQDERVKEILRSLGITYARAGGPSMSLAIQADRMAWQPTCHHTNGRLPELCDELFCDGRGEAGLLYVWGHSYEFEDRGNWELIENIAKRVGARDDVWYATNGEIDGYLRAYERLLTDGKTVTNPTDRDLFLSVNGRKILLRPGETTDF